MLVNTLVLLGFLCVGITLFLIFIVKPFRNDTEKVPQLKLALIPMLIGLIFSTLSLGLSDVFYENIVSGMILLITCLITLIIYRVVRPAKKHELGAK